ncbi:MAG: CRISPR system precrRNA processing endoribonuclease RAMP protein Cas6 [Promethearchaeia archaeon]
MIKLRLELIPANGHIKPYEIPFGYIFQSVIFRWLHKYKPKLYHKLHAYEEVRPYSLNCYIHENDPKVEFTIVSYHHPLSSALLKILTDLQDTELEVARKEYIVKKVDVDRIYLETLLRQSRPIKKFHIRFSTPCYFNTIKGEYPLRFPLPDALFGNIFNIWDSISADGPKLGRAEFISWIKAHIYPSRYQMRSASYYISPDHQIAGGQGFIVYMVKKLDEFYYKHKFPEETSHFTNDKFQKLYLKNSQIIDFLCKLGEYTNVGGHRTAGMGVIQYFPKKYIRNGD